MDREETQRKRLEKEKLDREESQRLQKEKMEESEKSIHEKELKLKSDHIRMQNAASERLEKWLNEKRKREESRKQQSDSLDNEDEKNRKLSFKEEWSDGDLPDNDPKTSTKTQKDSHKKKDEIHICNNLIKEMKSFFSTRATVVKEDDNDNLKLFKEFVLYRVNAFDGKQTSNLEKKLFNVHHRRISAMYVK